MRSLLGQPAPRLRRQPGPAPPLGSGWWGSSANLFADCWSRRVEPSSLWTCSPFLRRRGMRPRRGPGARTQRCDCLGADDLGVARPLQYLPCGRGGRRNGSGRAAGPSQPGCTCSTSVQPLGTPSRVAAPEGIVHDRDHRKIRGIRRGWCLGLRQLPSSCLRERDPSRCENRHRARRATSGRPDAGLGRTLASSSHRSISPGSNRT